MRLDAGASQDSDGTIVEYLWEFGDGTTATGSQVDHTYTAAGSYLVTLAVRDDQGGESFASAQQLIEVPAYDFSGFFAPVDQAPVLNVMKAGRAVPMKFSLGADYGLGILQTDSPTSIAINCTTGAPVSEVETTTSAGASSLSYNAATGKYSYVWKTASSWSGCRTFRLTLDDESVHTAEFMFR